MADDLFLCMASCKNINGSVLLANESYDLECMTQCSQHHAKLYHHTEEKYTQIVQIIAVVLITFGLIGKVFNCIIFLRKPLRGTSTGLLLLLKTIFDFVPLLWAFIFDTKFFVQDDQVNAYRFICALTRSSDIFVSWSIGFVILACTIRLATIVQSKYLPEPTRLHVFVLILLMMFCGALYNWHIFYYKSLIIAIEPEDNRTFSYCNILFGRQIGYFSFGGFRSTQELAYNAPIVNFIVSSLIPFAIIASTNIVIILRVLRDPSSKRLSKLNSHSNGNIHSSTMESSHRSSSRHSSIKQHVTKKDVSYETTITLTTSCVFLTTNSIASIYVYVKASYRPRHSRLTDDVKTSSVYLILRMLTLIDTVLEFYIYFLTGKKFRQEVYHVIGEILRHTPLRKFFKSSRLNNDSDETNRREQRNLTEIHLKKSNHSRYLTLSQSPTTTMSQGSSYLDSPQKPRLPNSYWGDAEETLERMESTV